MIIHTIRNLNRQEGGVPAAVVGLLGQVAQQCPHEEWRLLAHPGADALLSSTTLAPNCTWQPLEHPRSFRRALHPLLQRQAIQLIHDHGIWLPHNRSLAHVTRRRQIPRVVSLHGMLEPWAWQHKRWKKRLVWLLSQHHDLRTATALHATSPAEAARLHQLFPTVPIACIPLGVDGPPADLPAAPPTEAPAARQALFLSRLHEKKGVLNLIEAWHQIAPQGWQLVIAGPDEQGHRAILEHRIATLKLQTVKLVGPVAGATKWQYYQRADLFILPTYSENFGIVIAEALAAGTPVMTTQATPWAELVSRRCGWWIQTGVTPLVEALQVAMATSPAELATMGQRGQALIWEKYTWSQVAASMVELYQWLLKRAERPTFIIS